MVRSSYCNYSLRGHGFDPRPNQAKFITMGAITSLITSLTIVYSTVYSDADQRKHQSSASLAFVRGIHRGPVNPPHKWPVTLKIFPFDDVIMLLGEFHCVLLQRTVVRPPCCALLYAHRQTSNISRNLAGNDTVDHSDVGFGSSWYEYRM